MIEEKVILVDENDEPLGLMEKLQAHYEARLHRAISVLIYNSRGEMLLQQRAMGKYHTPGLWTNACCSHPRLGETELHAGMRRLQEEMGFTTDLKPLFSFVYKADLGKGLFEHEYDHVLEGVYDQDPVLNPDEAMGYCWIDRDELRQRLHSEPHLFTPWFRIIIQKMGEYGRPSPA